ncbi:ABC transporter ATP-binding protein [Flindersiella endophytica]
MPRSSRFGTLHRYLLYARLFWRSAPALSLVCFGLTVLVASAGTTALLTTGRLVAALPDAHAAWPWLVATALAFVAGPVASAALAGVAHAVEAKCMVTTLDLTMELGTSPYGTAHLENPKRAGELAAVTRASTDWLYIAGLHSGWTLIAIRLGGVGAFVILADWRWWAPILLLAGWFLLSRVFAQWNNSIFDDLLEVTGNQRRYADYLRSLLVGSEAAKEIRLFGLTGWLVGRYTSAWQQAMGAVWANRARALRRPLLALLLSLAVNAAVFGVLARDAWTGAVGAGALVTYAQAVLAMSAFGSQNDAQRGLARTSAVLNELVRLRRAQGLPALATSGEGDSRRPAEAGSGPASVVLEGVTFAYPSAEPGRPAISQLSLTIPAGQSVALVGVNGVGKSTLIKLLCGLYRPDEGSVRIGGADPGADDAARRRVAVIFQDFVRYHLPLRDNIAFDADETLLRKALHDAGGSGLLARLGWDTVLSPEYDDGTELSGGQWQRVALARALAALRTGAGVLVLDEPAAALDVRAEAALFDQVLRGFQGVVPLGRHSLEVTQGATTLLVTHRLSSVRHAERIVVLGPRPDGGAHVIEDGSHEELLAGGGVYAELFTLQAARFAMAAGRD